MYKFGVGSARGLFPVVVTFTVDRWDDYDDAFTIEPRQEPGEPDDIYGQFIQMHFEYWLRRAYTKFGHSLNRKCMSPEDLDYALATQWPHGYRVEGDPEPFFDSKTGRYIHEGDDPEDNVPVICGDCFQEDENPYPWETEGKDTWRIRVTKGTRDCAFVTILHDILAGRYGQNLDVLDKALDEAEALAEKVGLFEEYEVLFNQAADYYTEILVKEVDKVCPL